MQKISQKLEAEPNETKKDPCPIYRIPTERNQIKVIILVPKLFKLHAKFPQEIVVQNTKRKLEHNMKHRII